MSDWADDAAEKLAETWCTGHVALVDVVAAELRAAEERGRRRGVEDLQTMLQNAAQYLRFSEPLRLAMHRALSDRVALAPRDSGKEG